MEYLDHMINQCIINYISNYYQKELYNLIKNTISMNIQNYKYFLNLLLVFFKGFF